MYQKNRKFLSDDFLPVGTMVNIPAANVPAANLLNTPEQHLQIIDPQSEIVNLLPSPPIVEEKKWYEKKGVWIAGGIIVIFLLFGTNGGKKKKRRK